MMRVIEIIFLVQCVKFGPMIEAALYMTDSRRLKSVYGPH